MSLRDRLKGRQLPSATVAIRLDWSEESYALLRQLEDAEQRLALAKAGDGNVDESGTLANELRARTDAFYEFLTLRALPAAEMERLVADHPPTEEQIKAGAVNFNRETFFPALLAACVEGSETAEDWAQMLESGELVMGEVTALISTAMQLNDRSPSVSLGKGSTTTPS